MANQPTVIKALVLGVAVVSLSGVTLLPAHADSTTFDGPGFKVERKDGWFGTGKTTYYDAFGNRYEKKKGLFGREKTESKVFGSEVQRNGNNMIVRGPNGQPLVTRKKSWFGGKQTHIDGNGIFDSVKNVFTTP